MFKALAELFVNAFGITKPEAAQKQRAGIIIAGGLLAILAILALAAYTLFKMLS